MKINGITNNSFKGIAVKQTGASSPLRQIQKDNLKITNAKIDIMSKNANAALDSVDWLGIKEEEVPNVKAKGYHSGEKIYLKRIDDCAQIEGELEKTKVHFEDMLQTLQDTIKQNAKIDVQNQISPNAYRTLDATAKQNCSTKLSRIAGYDYEMDILKNEFIDKVLSEKSEEDSKDIPGSILFFGPNRNGKTLITQSVAEATEADIIDINSPDLKDNLMPVINKIAQEAKEKYKTTGKRTIIFMDEADRSIINSPYKNEFYEFIKTCSKDYYCTVFLATNKPLELGANFNDPDIFPVAMSIDPANHENKVAIIEKIIKTYNIEGLDVEAIVSEIEEKELDAGKVYSNEQIVDIAGDLGERIVLQNTDKKNAICDLRQNILPNYEPEITENDIKKFLEEYDIIINGAGVGNENIENQ